jgi:hypothetical protein
MKEIKEAVSRLGCILKNIPYEHGREYEYVFNLAHNTFFQKMVPRKIIECGFDMEPEKYFGLVIFLDYLTSVLLGDEKVLNNLRIIYEYMKKSSEAFKLESDLVILESALSAKELVIEYKNKTGKEYFREHFAEIKERYNQHNYIPDINSKSSRETDPYYNAIGLMIYNLFSDESKEELLHVKGKGDLKALLFVDYAMRYLKNEELRKQVKENLKRHDYFTASVLVIDELQKEVTCSLEEFKKKGEKVG